jgi:hypothetical protein
MEPTENLSKDVLVQLVLDDLSDHRIINEALKRVNRMIKNPGSSSDLFRYKMVELQRAIGQVKVHL